VPDEGAQYDELVEIDLSKVREGRKVRRRGREGE
jgi:hypothetical protein